VRLGEINIIGADLPRMQAFYCDLLGLVAGGQEGPDALHCHLGDARFLLLAVADGPAPATPYATRPTVSFDLMTPDLEGLCRRLADAGAVFERPPDDTSAIVRDPDGNVIELIQESSAAPADRAG